MQTPISKAERCRVGTFLSAPFECPTSTTLRTRFVLRADNGYLAATHTVEGPPIRAVADVSEAFGFVDFITAARRARALTELGWRNLRIVETLLL